MCVSVCMHVCLCAWPCGLWEACAHSFVQDVTSFQCNNYRSGTVCNNPLQLSLAFQALSLARIDTYLELGQGTCIALCPPPAAHIHTHREGEGIQHTGTT
jgi:hypothetical protein